MKTLVAYFSASGNTEAVAKKLAEALDADLFGIVPQVPYTPADIKWTNPLARCNREKLGRKDVPVVGRVERMEEYELVFLGFPIWYAAAPNVINTFVKDYDWTGKKIALFATSGGSGIGKTAQKLKPYLKGAPEIVAEQMLRPAESDAALKQWAEYVRAL